jgi:transcriptional regulator with XRE-family HTH domain
MPVDYKKLGERIRELRNNRGLSQEKLAEKTDLSRENINRFENANKYPGVDALVQIANALHVSVDDLLVDSWITRFPQQL